mgnify:CR=1 FL=1
MGLLRADRYLWEEVVTPFLVGVQSPMRAA